MAFTSQQLSDREEIRDLLNRWALAVDAGDFDTFEACYTGDVVIDFKAIGYQGSSGRGHREFVEKSAPNFRAMQHVLSNVIFLEETATTARTRTMVTAATVGHDEVVFFMGAYYHDDLRKTPDGWRICRRRAERVYIHNFPGAYDPKSVPANR